MNNARIARVDPQKHESNPESQSIETSSAIEDIQQEEGLGRKGKREGGRWKKIKLEIEGELTSQVDALI